jgi:hypothetical protein
VPPAQRGPVRGHREQPRVIGGREPSIRRRGGGQGCGGADEEVEGVVVGRQREVPEGRERKARARARPARVRAKERVVGVQSGGAAREDEAHIGEVVGSERGDEGGEVRRGGEAARYEEVRVLRGEAAAASD